MSNEIYNAGEVVAVTDRDYTIEGSKVVFDEVSVKGNMNGELEYEGVKLRITIVGAGVSITLGPEGACNTVWKGVECEVIK